MKIDFEKDNDLVPAIIQDATTKKVLMLGYMNEEAYKKTLDSKQVTFFSRSKNRLWTKGEESGHFLNLVDIKIDCDNDTLLVFVNPIGPTCHTGTDTCWKEDNIETFGFLSHLEKVITDRKDNPDDKSYTSSLFKKGINKIAQKVGEEAVELVIESKDDDKDLFLNEGADLIYHFLVLLQAKGYSLSQIVDILKDRHK
jgi:phosphoribosyl-ATP pyrophosphohydrolase/phosphoribosyl-AMP cyclohydrolase